MSDIKYFPIMKWKQGEYLALSNLDNDIKDRICPIIEVPPMGYDHEDEENKKTLDEHLANIGKRLKSNWEKRQVYVDISTIVDFDSSKKDCIAKIFSLYEENECSVVPVILLNESDECLSEFKKIIKKCNKGVMLRLKNNDLEDSDIEDKIKHILDVLEINISDIDLLVDLGKIRTIIDDETTYSYMSDILLQQVPFTDMWKRMIVSASSFPAEDNSKTITTSQRLEWLFYKYFTDRYSKSFRPIFFSDYNVDIPEYLPSDLDPRTLRPLAKLKYTTDDGWHYHKGNMVKGYSKKYEETRNDLELGYKQYVTLCKKLKEKPYFRGERFSYGDKCIYDCANGDSKTGNLSTWIKVAVNQHISKVVSDLSTFHDFSLYPSRGFLEILEATLQ